MTVAMPVKRELSNDTEFARMYWEELSLYAFVLEFWPVIEPGKPFVDGKHIHALCKHLEAAFYGEFLRVLINMPPRFAKSSIVVVLFMVWAWTKKPSLRFLCASYALSLATRDNIKCRRIILSPKFQEHYGHLFTLMRDQNAKIKFENNQLGVRQAVSVGSSATGEGFDIGIIDDAHAIDEKRSDVTREGTLDWFKDTWCTRLNDPLTSVMIVVGHRIHANDLSGYILEGNTGEHWVHLNLANEFEPGDKCITYLPDGIKFWEDWRELEGELLWPDRFPPEVVARAKRRHGPLGYASLYQQRPVPAGGNIFQRKNQRYFTIDYTTECYLLETPRGIKPVPFKDCWKLCTVDLAISEKQSADYTVFAAYAVTPFKDLLLLEIIHEHFAFNEQVDQLVLFHEKYGFSLAAIESVFYQLAMVQTAKDKGLPAQEFHPPSDKVTRSTTASIWESNGKCYSYKHANWLFEYETEIFDFPKASHDDQVDTRSMSAIVVCTRKVPGVLDLDSDDIVGKIDPTLSIEQIIDASVIQAEQARLSLEVQREQEEQLFTRGPQVDVFAWAAEHEGGG